MRVSSILGAVPLLSSLFFSPAVAQELHTDAGTGITVFRQTIPDPQTKGGLQWGIALPPTTAGPNDEYIGQLVGSINSGTGWTGVSHGGGMTNNLLLLAWADGTTIRTSFRYVDSYTEPPVYKGNAVLTKISSKFNATHFDLIYHCKGCWAWSQDGAEGGQSPTNEVLVFGWAQSLQSPTPPTSESANVLEHNNGFGNYGLPTAPMRQADYAKWVPEPPTTTTTTTTTTASGTPTPTPSVCSGSAAPNATYDYIVVGAGAAGIPIADKLSESGKSVLLIEKGPPSSGRWGGKLKPTWLEGTNLTRFDVPGLCNEIWVNSGGVACTGVDQMAGCVLGGGTAVNAGLWWRPVKADWEYNFPSGWKSADLQGAVDRVFKRIPGTDHPSKDGRLYLQQGYNVLANALAAGGWKNLTKGANAEPDSKDKVFAQTPYMFSNAERGGPMATYLVSASARKNFKLLTDVSVKRVIRSAGHATGVEVDAGLCGTINVTPNTGRVILAAGVFNTAKILFRSGIGPKDQLDIVAKSAADGAKFINSTEWINLPVGSNLDDHLNTDIVVRHPNVSFYDFYQAYDDPIKTDKDAYLQRRSGILAQAAPNIGPLFWEVIPGSVTGDNIPRQLQYTARVEASLQVVDNTSMTISQYLGRGATSRGKLSINGALSIQVTDVPYLKTPGDIAAVKAGLTNVINALKKNPQIVVERPAAGQSVSDFVDKYEVSTGARRSNHWIGSTKIGTDSGLYSGGTAVVDLNTRIYGTDNIYVVDAGIFPGHVTTNPSSYIVSAAEKASENILASPLLSPVAKFGQCGGRAYTGARFCVSGTTCKVQNPDYAQCL